ncbi:DUF4345 domain-containing protein [Flavobacterium sp.]|uniref:DUF4345 domain-containing protein n=1 Tax=Flavobacterium sp. TaxID=239 RepID=UPI00286E14EC|nr:DUF4345 domain-containing protein [Flavobacterium sp.]
MILKNFHLSISVIIVIPIAIVYGFWTNLVFNVNIDTVDEHNILKAIMGLYLGFATLWIIGIFKSTLWKTATISNIVFMLGLAFGRIVSLFIEGITSTVFILGTFGELILGFYGWYQFKKYNSQIL